jgi:hypothetical protein
MRFIPIGYEYESDPAYPQIELGTRKWAPARSGHPGLRGSVVALRAGSPLVISQPTKARRSARSSFFLDPPSVDFGVGVVLGTEGQAIGDAAAIGC